jgi:hypothetical protein
MHWMIKEQSLRDRLIVYNKETTETENLSSINVVRVEMLLWLLVGGNLNIFGGQTNFGNILDTIKVLDLKDPQEWKLFTGRLETIRHACSAVVAKQ